MEGRNGGTRNVPRGAKRRARDRGSRTRISIQSSAFGKPSAGSNGRGRSASLPRPTAPPGRTGRSDPPAESPVRHAIGAGDGDLEALIAGPADPLLDFGGPSGRQREG